MSDRRVAAFTDTYLPTVNGVTYTVQSWQAEWAARGGRMDVVYPASDHEPENFEHPVRSLPFPFYDGFRVGVPRIPGDLGSPDVVHAHTPFSLGLSARRLASKADAPLVASYHTPTAEYAAYVSMNGTIERTLRGAARSYERWFLNRADVVVVPSAETGRHVEAVVGVETPIEVVPNGVDTEFFRPVDDGFRARHGLPDGPLVGYTGRHGYEKNLEALVAAVGELAAEGELEGEGELEEEGELDGNVTLVFGGDGPARTDLEAAARDHGVDARFLGFLDREELPAFYTALDVFGFPSPVETQGLVALEANACGTPVAGVDAGALADTIEDGENGYTAPDGDVSAFARAIERTLEDRERLSAVCLDRRDEAGVGRAVDELEAVYEDLLAAA